MKDEKSSVEENKIENKENVKNSKNLKVGFFKKVWNSITKIEKYPEMSAEGLGKSFSYLSKIIAILAIILCLGTVYQVYKYVQEGIVYLQNDFPNFTYKDGNLNVEKDETIYISEENSILGKTIINTKIEDEQEINKFINDIEKAGSGIVVLNNRILLKNAAVSGMITYNYNQIFEKLGITEFSKQDVINYAKSSQIINLYVSIFITIFIYAFIMYIITSISNAILLSIFGYLAAIMIKIKMRFVAIFNMAIYSLTLSIILNIIYVIINIFVSFNIQYFQVMYMSVAAIYLIAAIFILRLEFIKKQAELIKIAEAQVEIKKQLEEENQEKHEEENKRNREKEKKKKEEQENKSNQEKNNNEGEPKGSEA